MKIRKTRIDERSTYRYPVDVADGKGGYRTEYITIHPGEDGVTEADIKTLHSLDDSEVYYNNKNLRPEKTEEEKAAMEVWRKQYVEKITIERGYAPSKDEVEDAVKEVFPSNWNLSLDFIVGDDEEGSDKSKVLFEASVVMESSDPSAEHLHEVMESMTELQRKVLTKHWFDGESLTMIAAELKTSVANVSKHYKKAIKYIEDNYYKK